MTQAPLLGTKIMPMDVGLPGNCASCAAPLGITVRNIEGFCMTGE